MQTMQTLVLRYLMQEPCELRQIFRVPSNNLPGITRETQVEVYVATRGRRFLRSPELPSSKSQLRGTPTTPQLTDTQQWTGFCLISMRKRYSLPSRIANQLSGGCLVALRKGYRAQQWHSLKPLQRYSDVLHIPSSDPCPKLLQQSLVAL